MKDGDVIAWERSFTEDDIQLFGRLSGDLGEHHVVPDEQGRVMVQGLLTATLPTKIGGDLNFIARELTFEFLRPVFAGDRVRCEVTVGGLVETEHYTRMSFTWVCRNQHDKEVMIGRGYGVVRSPTSEHG